MRRGAALVVVAAALWGTLGVTFKILHAHGLPAISFGFWRAALAAMTVAAWLVVTDPRQLRIERRDLPLFVAYGLVSVTVFYAIYPLAIQYSSVAVAAVLLYTAPAWVALMAAVFLGERLTWLRGGAILLTFAGCVLVSQAYDAAQLRGNTLGVLAGLGSGLTYAAMSIFGRISLRKYTPATSMVYALSIGSLCLLPLAWSQGAAFWAGWSRPVLFLYAALIPTTLSFLLYTTGLGLLGNAGRASLLATVEPLAAAISGYLILGEALAPPQWAGGALILLGVLLL